MKILSRAEELILLAVLHLRENAYGVSIRRYINEMTREDWSIGAVYVPLDRLSKWDFLKTLQGDPTPERGGRSKRYYELTQAGLEALNHTRRVQDEMWARARKLQTG